MTILSYPALDLVIVNNGKKLLFASFTTSDIQEFTLTHDIGDLAIDLNSMILYLVAGGGLFEEDFEQILTKYNANTLAQHSF